MPGTMETPRNDAPLPGPGPLSIIQVLFSPAAVFDRIAARPTVLAPMVILMLSGIVVATVMSFRVDWEKVIVEKAEEAWAKDPRTANMSEEQKSKTREAMAGIAKAMPVMTIGAAFIMPPLFYIVITALFWVLFKLVAGSDWGFKTALSATIHGLAPSMVAGLVVVSVMLAGDPATLDLEDPIRSHLGALADKEAVGVFAWHLLASVEFFMLWRLALLVIGYKRTAKASGGATVGIVLAAWVVFVLGKSLVMAALEGMQSGG